MAGAKNWKDGAARAGISFANRFNPVVGDPSSPLKTASLFDSFGPSLMPRASMHQGLAAAVSILAAEAVGKGVDSLVRKVVPSSSPYVARIGARAAATGIGFALTKIPQTDDERTAVASVRTVGRLAMAGAVGGMVYESGVEIQRRLPAAGPLRPTLVGLGGFAGALLYSQSLLKTRIGIIQRWSEEDKPASLPGSIGIGFVAANAGRWIGRGYVASRSATMDYFGDDPARRTIGRLVNAAIWVARSPPSTRAESATSPDPTRRSNTPTANPHRASSCREARTASRPSTSSGSRADASSPTS